MAAVNKLRPMLTAIRCAIYTRKSTDEGLDSDFNTLDAQRESAEAFIISQRHEGWLALPQKYDDGGFTGANTARRSRRVIARPRLRQDGVHLGGNPLRDGPDRFFVRLGRIPR
jgi:site-specific DNA recombinase